MTARTARIAGLSAALTISVALTGCGILDNQASGKDTKVSVATPRDALLQAVPDEKAGAYKFDIKQNGVTINGVLDPVKKAYDVKVVTVQAGKGFKLTVNDSTKVLKEGTWVKISFSPANLQGLPKMPKKWMKVDLSKVKNAKDSLLQYDENAADPGSTQLVVANAVDVQDAGAGKYTGTTDLTKTTDSGIAEEETLTALGDKAKAVPFTATVAGGHLVSLVVDVPAAGKTKAYKYTVAYAGFGATATPTAPAAGEQTAATPAAYEYLNS
nr:hypothetical protein [uncultured Actinoplanes sp.]